VCPNKPWLINALVPPPKAHERQGDRISELGEKVDKIVVVPGCELEFRTSRHFLRILAHDVERKDNGPQNLAVLRHIAAVSRIRVTLAIAGRLSR